MRVSSATWVSIGLTLMAVCVVSGALALGLIESSSNVASRVQMRSAETLALQLSSVVTAGDGKLDPHLIEQLISSTPNLDSLGLRRADGQLVAASPAHETLWVTRDTGALSSNRVVEVPLFIGKERWGKIELIYRTPVAPSVLADWQALGFVGAMSMTVFLLYMRRTLRVLDPSAAVPERVKNMLNTLTEGAAILDMKGQIMLANRMFAELFAKPDPNKLLGQTIEQIHPFNADSGAPEWPWQRAMRGETVQAATIDIVINGARRTVLVNASPVWGYRTEVRGALLTLDDVTAIREKNEQLEKLVEQLNATQEHVRQKNEELQRLASRDALTGCLNRRAFHEQLDHLFGLAMRHTLPLSVVMVDVDHFKSVNDRFGHARGDDVLKQVAERLREGARATDVVCRFGGEEFCVLLPHTDLDGAAILANHLRELLASTPIAGLGVTASFGASSTQLGATTPVQLVEQADAALYESKRDGRNRVTKATRSQASPQANESPALAA